MLLALSLNALNFTKPHRSQGCGIVVDAFPQGITEERFLLSRGSLDYSRQQRFQCLLLDQALIGRKVTDKY